MAETVWVKDTPMYPNGVVLKDGNLYVPAKIGTLRLKKNGAFYTIYKHTCCGFEYVENNTDSSTDYDPRYCMKCGARMVEDV